MCSLIELDIDRNADLALDGIDCAHALYKIPGAPGIVKSRLSIDMRALIFTHAEIPA